MRHFVLKSIAACIAGVFIPATLARGEIKTVVEHIDNAHATADVKFNDVPAPSKTDAATHAKFSIAAGSQDSNSGELDKLNDGQMPTDPDEPLANFFFADGHDGGRLQIDLGSAIQIKQVNTYSWHPNTRAPQVYSLYASDGSVPGFNASPDYATDPTKAGWRLVASIDTRPTKTANASNTDIDAMGGQYGVSVSDSAGSIGRYRYLLLVVSQTEHDDDWGNTFYSEIDVIEDAAPGNAK
jgi:hypothetical protein